MVSSSNNHLYVLPVLTFGTFGMALLHNSKRKGFVERKLFVALPSCSIEENGFLNIRLHCSLGFFVFSKCPNSGAHVSGKWCSNSCSCSCEEEGKGCHRASNWGEGKHPGDVLVA